MERDTNNSVRTITILDEQFEQFVKLMDAGGKQFGYKVLFEEQEDVL